MEVNYLAVLVAAVGSMVLGGLWWSPLLFGKSWMAAMGKTEADIPAMKKKAPLGYAVSFIGALVTSYVMAHMVDYTGADDLLTGIKTGFWIWLGFVVTTHIGLTIFEGRPMKVFTINTTFNFVNLAMMGVINAVWK